MKPCSRKWQVAAARDGRLRGKDLSSAERHQDTCAECAQEARELGALSHSMLQLPTLTRDAIAVHRTRQQLLSAFNESVLEPRGSSIRVRAPWVLAGAAALLTSLWFVAVHKTSHSVATASAASVVQVQASPGAHWTEHLDHELDRIDFSTGSASFRVRPHPGRRVIVSLPDGEIEDLGTVFAVLVQDQVTRRVAVSEGRVSLRLRGRAETVLRAGEFWEVAAPLAEPNAAPPAVVPAAARPSLSSTPLSNTRATPARPLGSDAPTPVGTVPPAAAANKTVTESAQAEDDAYLHVVALLRAGKQEDARAEAKQYLLRFPNGFRRVEVLNIVTR